MSYIPKIHILYAMPLNRSRETVFKRNNWWYPSVEETKQGFNLVKNLWEKSNIDNRIVLKLIEVLGIAPSYDLEFYVLGKGITAGSVPLLLPLYKEEKLWSDEWFIDTIIHELIHRFCASPREEHYETKEYWKYLRETYKELSIITQNHLIVYAVLKKVLPVVFTEEQIKDIRSYEITPEYKQAIDLVEEKGADFFIQEFKDKVI